MKNLLPDIYVDSISDITASMLLKMGMEAVVLDIDNTLVPHNDPNPTAEVRRFLQDMKEGGIKLCVVSNNSFERVKPFCDKIGIDDFVCDALKPRSYGYKKAAVTVGVEKGKICAIGDQIFTDVWGANRAGIKSILVRPISQKGEGTLIFLKRILEAPIIHHVKKRGESK